MTLTLKVQTWSDDLRLPCIINAAETTGLLTELEPLRRPSIPFQSKHLPALKRNKWFALKRPADRSRSGLLVLWPAHQACVYVSGDPKRPDRVALLRVRVDPQFFGAGLTVFAATLSGSRRSLMIEDTLMWKGRLATEAFSARWALAVQWVEHYCIVDTRLLSGLQVEMAAWGALSAMTPDGVWDLQSEDEGARRLLWIAAYHAPDPVPVPAPAHTSPVLIIQSLVAAATRETGPEQWGLYSSDGISLGRALVRTLDLSSQLRSSKANTLRVEVTWNTGFGKWEIKGLAEGGIAVSHSANFQAAK